MKLAGIKRLRCSANDSGFFDKSWKRRGIKNCQVRCTKLVYLIFLQEVANHTHPAAVWCNLLDGTVDSATRNSSGDEIANVNFCNDDIVPALQNTIDSCMNAATHQRGYVREHRFTKFSEITQCNGHYAVQCHSRLPIFVPIESSYTTSY